MAFCQSCGAQLNGEAFCPKCGAPTNGEIRPAQNNGGGLSLRGQNLKVMDDLLEYFGRKTAQYDEYDEVDAKLDEWSTKSYAAALVFGIILTIIGLILTFASCNGKSAAGVGVPMLLIGLGLIALFVLLNIKKKKTIQELTNRLLALSLELQNHYEAYYDCPVGMEYTNPKILFAVKDMIRSGRADNPATAINLMLEDHHKREMELLAKQTKEAAEQTAASTQKAAKYAKRASFWSAADFFLK